jgi:C-terminal processing protease CtpA/Prc
MSFRFKLLFFTFFYSSIVHAQRPLPVNDELFNSHATDKWNKAGIQRIADVGRLWGVIKYFHPFIITGKLDADELILSHTTQLLNEPSRQNFTVTVKGMLSDLHDPTTQVIPDDSNKYVFHELLKPNTLAKGVAFISAPQARFKKGYTVDSCVILRAPQVQAYVVDLRNNTSNDELGLKQYQNFVQPLIGRIIDHTLIMSSPRTAFYHAMLRQDFRDDLDAIPASDRKGDPNYWYQERFGLKSTSQGAYLLASKEHLYKGKKFCFLVNQFNDPNTLKALLALKNRNGCYLIFDGAMPEWLVGEYYHMQLSDGIRVKVKVAEQIYEDGSLGTGPNYIFEDHSKNGNHLLTKAISYLTNPPAFYKMPVETNTYIRLPQNSYANNIYPEVKLRLLGLFNLWNVIHYFCPNKNLITSPWNEVLNYFVPRFVFAKDYRSYYWLLREISAKLNDGHAEVLRNNDFLPPQGINGYYAPFCVKYLEGKTIIVKLVPGSDKSTLGDQVKVGDEIVSIDDVPIKELYRQWLKYVGISNEVNYFRSLHKFPLISRNGPKEFKLTVVRNHKILGIQVKPVEKEVYLPTFYAVYFPEIVKPYWKIINDSTGYVRVNNIYSNQVDSVWTMLRNRKYIIIDARGYPRDERIVKSIAGPFMIRADTVCINAFPEITSPILSRNAVSLEAEVVTPPLSNIVVHGKKKFILLCAAGNGSQAETNIISWQRILHPITIGTTTVGANGVSNTILMPGGYAAHYSGFGVYYTDGTPNQKFGVKIDIPVGLSIKGDLEGRDEIFEKAMKYIAQSK